MSCQYPDSLCVKQCRDFTDVGAWQCDDGVRLRLWTALDLETILRPFSNRGSGTATITLLRPIGNRASLFRARVMLVAVVGHVCEGPFAA